MNSNSLEHRARLSHQVNYLLFVFHELGHNFGAHHNIEQDTNSYYPYGHGHLISAGNGVQGSTTILAYTRSGHSTRANYYSNPDQLYPPTGTPLGVSGVSNNARLLMENRRAFSKIGNEIGKCGQSDKCSHDFLPFCIIEKLVSLKKKLLGVLKPCIW